MEIIRNEVAELHGMADVLRCVAPMSLCRQCLHKLLLDHISTTDRGGNNGGCTSQKFWKRFCLGQKPIKTSRNGYKKYRKSLGKDEVGGSNPPSSSKKSCFREKTGLFLCFSADLICGSGRGATLTHTLTHTRKCAERVKEDWTEKSVVLKCLFFVPPRPCIFRESVLL